MREIYNRDPNDPNYDPLSMEISDKVEICIGQIKMLLLTSKGEVLGDPRFGLNLEDLIFTLELSENAIKKELDLFINNYIPLFSALNGRYELKFFEGTLRDIATLDFFIPSLAEDRPAVALRLT